VNLIAHLLRLLAFCFGHDAGPEMVVVVVVVVVGYGHMYDAGTCTVLVLEHGLPLQLNMNGMITSRYNCGTAIIDT